MGQIEAKLNAMGYQLPPPFTFPQEQSHRLHAGRHDTVFVGAWS